MTKKCITSFITTEEVAENLGNTNFKILDLREFKKFKENHIPGSIHVDSHIFTKLDEYGYNTIPSKENIISALQKAGINNNDKLILIDDVFNLNCSLPAWTLNFFGINGISLIDGALAKWEKENHPMTKEINENHEKGNFTIRDHDTSITITKDEIIVYLDSDDFIFLDNRSEFALTMDQQGGNIPRAIHYWWMDMFAEHREYFILKPPEEILLDLERLNVEKDKTIVTYCESAPQSALVYLVMKDLGYKDVRLYLAGYNEWRAICGFL